MGSVGRRLVAEVTAARRHVAVTVAAGIVVAVTVVAQATLLAHILASAVVDGASLTTLTGPIVWLAIVSAIRAVCAGVFEISGTVAGLAAARQLRRRLADAALGTHPTTIRGDAQGEVVAAATTGVDALMPYFSQYLPQVVLSAVVPVAILMTVIPVDLTSAVIMAVTVPLVPVFMVLIGKAAQARTRARWRALSRLSAHFLDVVRGLPTLRVNNRAEAQDVAVRRTGERHRVETMATLRIAFLSALVLELMAMLATALVAVTIGVRLAEGSMGLEASLAVLILAPELFMPLRQLGTHYHAAADATAAAEAVFDVVDATPTVTVPERPRPVPSPVDHAIVLDHVWFAYGADAPVLRDLTVEVQPGEFTALVGPSGAGKSTLGMLLARLLQPTRGTIRVGDTDLARVDPERWRERVAWVPQRPHLFPSTLAENIRMARPAASDDEVRTALLRARAPHLAAALDEPLGERGRGLSAGERRRVGIARAVLRDAELVILDEPTAELDPETAADVVEVICELAEGRTMVVATHAPGLADRADRIVALTDGTPRAEPSPLLEVVR
ncbi:MAG: thiol reductant ABC exporter subunit CydD [Thermoleophilia bacterium]|nr:thiol reductant ABC exporter subunit CydD [Thermoleophilia bacterium]